MDRRDLLKKALGFGAAVGLPGAGALARSLPATNDAQHAFASSFADVHESYGPTRIPFRGRLPAETNGTLYRNGPARMRRGPTAYEHWFDGDGMLNAYRIGGGALVHQARMIRTARYVQEERAGRFLHGGFGTALTDAQPVMKPDDMNVANISVLPMPGPKPASGGSGKPKELLALWEAGSAYRIAPDTLETLGRKVWSPETDGLAFSAHPRVDADGTVWSFGYLPGSGKLVLYRIGAAGAMELVAMVDAPNADMVHDFAITERWLVFLLMPLRFSAEAAPNTAFVDRYRWHGDQPSVLLAIDKATWQQQIRIELPPFALFHLGNAWEEGAGGRELHVQAMQVHDFAETNAAIRQLTQGAAVTHNHLSTMIEVVADLNTQRGRVEQGPLDACEFPSWDKRRTGLRTRDLFGLVRTPSATAAFNGVARCDRDAGRIDVHDYGSDFIAEEHLFVARPDGGEGDGWLLGTIYHWPTRTTRLVVLDAQHLADGPVAEARLPYGLPLGLHGAFVGA